MEPHALPDAGLAEPPETGRLAESHIEAAVREERERLAQEIHDTLAQAFTGILLQLRVAQRISAQRPDDAWRLIDRAGELAKQGLAEARRAVWALQPDAAEYERPDVALAGAVERARLDTQVEIALHVAGTPRRVPADVGLSLVRVAEEAITNALRHAAPHLVWVDISFGAADVRLRVQDDGCGFDMERQGDQGGFGLLGMGQRARRVGGSLTVTSRAGRGTEISAILPTTERRTTP
jgi:signal transduction histidine kinase